MTFAMSLKVGDGIVIAADSASTMIASDEHGRHLGVINIYRNANKIVNLVRGLPIGVCIWGLGGIGSHSIEFLLKELRLRLSYPTSGYEDWLINQESYSISEVAQRVRQFIYEEEYSSHITKRPGESPTMGMLVTGYSAPGRSGEIHEIQIDADGECGDPVVLAGQDDSAVLAFDGQTDAVQRLIFGFSPSMGRVLVDDLGVPEQDVPQLSEVMRSRLSVPLVNPQMPIQDAIDLAEFLVDIAAKFARFMPQPESVAGEIEIAAITKHEGFKWVRRKHFYSREMNPSPPTRA